MAPGRWPGACFTVRDGDSECPTVFAPGRRKFVKSREIMGKSRSGVAIASSRTTKPSSSRPWLALQQKRERA